MNDSERHAIEGIRVLWPHLHPHERLQWVERLRHLYNNDFTTTVKALAQGITTPEQQ